MQILERESTEISFNSPISKKHNTRSTEKVAVLKSRSLEYFGRQILRSAVKVEKKLVYFKKKLYLCSDFYS